ncbi:PIG-L family deacetylase [Chryseosolibacter indicus]|uniref:PIG-L family deacetylase n=1 Tax=Chryseosolibacter indicus TaxID=2782351 RepID=A0ABS5VKF4_9BACT|nr:PIG-L family deacetylase [Chryseosolibacter indicus]MBT1701922.1 PIG-L family deacetylase [Chryseosolibacter indicus]
MRKVFLFFLLTPIIVYSQTYQQPDAAQIKLRLKKLNFLGSVLYMAAHPDDENTKVITYLSNDRLATTAYLSLTRGDGGQNLIGPEIRDLLGVIRTQELLAARRVDGGLQFFTRANDFGFSKSPNEAFSIWGKQEVFSDVIKVFRQYQPDVIITRFPPDERAGHGHHTASAILANEAFDASADPNVYPEQLKELKAWQPKRLYTNTGRWWNKDIDEKSPGVLTLDVGGYNQLLGKSYTEIAALSSSQHRSQGWGTRGVRGYFPEFLEYMKGERAQKDVFDGINTTWTRLKGGDKVQVLVDRVIKEFQVENPSAIVPTLLLLRKAINSLEEGIWKQRKLKEAEQLIKDCLGLYLEVTSSHYQTTQGEELKNSFELVNRSSFPLTLKNVRSASLKWDTTCLQELKTNNKIQFRSKIITPEALPYSDPYWLQNPHTLGLFNVHNKAYIGLPENPPAISYTFTFEVGEELVDFEVPLIYKWTDHVKGEMWRALEIVPPVFINTQDKVLIFSDDSPKQYRVVLKSSSSKKLEGTLKLKLPEGWRAEPSAHTFSFTRRDDELIRTFTIYPSVAESKGVLEAIAVIDGKEYNKSIQLIQYDHIPVQTILPIAQTNVVKIGLKKEGKTIAYIKGAGDEVPNALRNMGYDVWEMKNEEVTPDNLKRVDAVVLGVRALNTNDRIRYFMNDLLAYAKEGGTVVVQYNTSNELWVENFSPFQIKLSRDRVTEEDAEVRILKPDHVALNYPNKITAKDFEGWVQERGLYFPSQWDANFEALLSMNDKRETPKDGSLLVAKYGNGYYVYTGLSFFRELPEGVSGAYKLFANLVSLGKQPVKTEATKEKSKEKPNASKKRL